MRSIKFYINIKNVLLYSCYIIKKLYSNKEKLIVFVKKRDLIILDELLWTFSSIDFLPHCLYSDYIYNKSPIILTFSMNKIIYCKYLLNLTNFIPNNFFKFDELFEIIGNTKDELYFARNRYKYYRKCGYFLRVYKDI